MDDVISTGSIYYVVDTISSLLMYKSCLLTLSHSSPFISPLPFSFKNMRDHISDSCCSFVRLSGSIGMNMVMSCSWVGSFVIASSAFLLKFRKKCFKLYCVVITPRIYRSCSSPVIALTCSAFC